MMLDGASSTSSTAVGLAHTEALLKQLCDLLDHEMGAIARCDFGEISRIDQCKHEILREFEESGIQGKIVGPFEDFSPQTHDQQAAKTRIAATAKQVQTRLRVNSVLMDDAIAAISIRLGIDSSPQLYDKHARTVGLTRRASSRSI